VQFPEENRSVLKADVVNARDGVVRELAKILRELSGVFSRL